MSDTGHRDGEHEKPGQGLAALHFRRRRPGRHRRLTRGLPAILAIGGIVPVYLALNASHHQQSPSVIVCSGYSGCDSHGRSSHSYGAHSSTSYWRMYAGNECTNYTAYVESTVFRAPAPSYLLGNGGQWAQTAAAHGVLVNHTPSVGAVAEWDGGTYGMGPAGHVAVVERIGPRGRYIVISQQDMGGEADGYDWTRIYAGHPADQWQEWPSNFIHFKVGRHVAVGYFDPPRHLFRLRDSISSGPVRFARAYGRRGVIPLTGDWTGHGRTGIGFYDPKNGTFHLRAWPQGGRYKYDFRYGPPGMIPLTGDWAGNGRSSVGYYDPENGTFHLRLSLTSSRTYRAFRFGPRHMIPLAGNWGRGRRDGVGYYNPSSGRFHLRDSPSPGRASAVFRFGPRHMIPLVGNWGGGSRDGIGYYDPRNGWFHLRNSAGRLSYAFRFGPRHMIPLAGDWAGR
jgi:surface antigen